MNAHKGVKGFVRLPVQERIEAQTVFREGSSCNWWTGVTDGRYGIIWVDGKRQKAHRVVWELANGPIPDGKHICHHCDNPPCVRLDHLFLGDPASNARDR